jgi:NAD(P)-dependent dehydrogenase (short-subunit alcohol dehydrogenase family)
VFLDLDVAKLDSIRAAAEATGRLLPGGLDYLLSNAGIDSSSDKTFETVYVYLLVFSVCSISLPSRRMKPN